MSAHEHSFSYDNDPRPAECQRSLCCACGEYLFQHAPGHPYGSQAGPGGMYAHWCLRPECAWRETTRPAEAGYASTAAVLLFCILGSLAFLAFLHYGQKTMCATSKPDERPAYCTEQAR